MPREFRHATRNSYYKRKCRCDACVEWHGVNVGVRKRLTHGTKHAYYDKGCRCASCLSWAGRLGDHGTVAMWSDGCRCDLCQRAFPELALEHRSLNVRSLDHRPERQAETSKAECQHVHHVTGERCILDAHHEAGGRTRHVAVCDAGAPLYWEHRTPLEWQHDHNHRNDSRRGKHPRYGSVRTERAS